MGWKFHRSLNAVRLASSLSLLVLGSFAALALDYGVEGNEYSPLGKTAGDQTASALALKGDGGLLVWQDNTDSEGLGIRARLLGAQLSGLLESFRINSTETGDQENPVVACLKSGDYMVFWQSGIRGKQKIFGRLLKSNGVFGSGEIQYSSNGNQRAPAATVLSDGTVVLVWTASGVDGDMDGVQSVRLNQTGASIGAVVTVNVSTRYNQRDAVVGALSDGGYAIAWIDEQHSGWGPAGIAARIYSNVGEPRSGEIGLVTGPNPAATPSIASVEAGFVVAWSQLDRSIIDNGWDVYSQAFDNNGASKSVPTRINVRTASDQTGPRLVTDSSQVFVTYVSEGIDGSGKGIAGRFFSAALEVLGDELVINRQYRGDQFSPAAALSSGRILVVWSGFDSAASGVDLRAQRLSPIAAPLAAPNAPYVTSISSSRLLVTWPAVDGISVNHYEVYSDGNPVPAKVAENFLNLQNLPPSSAHSFRIAYVLSDTRRSPLSPATAASTWASDENADGLPDDWETRYFGSDTTHWPQPDADSDNDGRSNRDEFLMGTNPIDSTSVLRTWLAPGAQGPVLKWNAQPGAMYQVQASYDLGEWQDLGGRRLATGSVESAPLGEATTNAYYRVNFLR